MIQRGRWYGLVGISDRLGSPVSQILQIKVRLAIGIIQDRYIDLFAVLTGERC